MPTRLEQEIEKMQQEGRMRHVRKQIKRNRKAKRVRRKTWTSDFFDDPDAFEELAETERIMPRGERERRKAVLTASLATLEEQEAELDEGPAGDGVDGPQGVVVEVSTGLCRVDLDGRILLCGLRGSLTAEDTGLTNVVAVGDEVILSEVSGDRGVIETVLPRQSALSRPHVFYHHLKQVLAANVDQLLVVASWRDPAFWAELVDRYLIAAERNNLAAIICVNKIDLAEDVDECRAALQPYRDLGYRVLFTSALTGKGVGRVRKVLGGHTTVLAGLSGVGKSLLLSAVQPGLTLRTTEVSEHSREGRHTTTQARLYRLEMGGAVVDTPGIREFGLSGLRRRELAGFYPEIVAVAGSCHFGNCSHTDEPECAVRMAVPEGAVSAMRYHSYRRIYDSLPD